MVDVTYQPKVYRKQGGNELVVKDGGKLIIGSAETANIEIESGGALSITGTHPLNYNYGAGGDTKMHKGAIVDSTVAQPLGTQLAPGDGIHGIWLADSNVDALVGDGGGGSLSGLRGLASTINFTYSSTVTETAGGSLGPLFRAQPATQFEFNGATVDADGANTIKLQGPGNFKINGIANDFKAAIEGHSTGLVQVDDADGLLASTVATITMYSGWFDVDNATALNGATVTMTKSSPGSIFRLDQNLTTGTVTIDDGGWMTLHRTEPRLTSGATFNFNAGAGILGSNYYSGMVWPITDPVNIALPNDSRGIA
ncbi:hypothetical protein LCGC14_2890130, partial [marine sediment metagenome]